MKNTLLLVAVFLGGITTQLMGQEVILADDYPNNRYQRYDYVRKRSVQFVENGILFTLYTDGRFSFTNAYRYRHVNHGRNGRPIRVKTNRRGDIVKVNGTRIHYKRNGKVKRIGRVPVDYYRGRVQMIGGLSLEYNRRGWIRRTFGYVNRFNDQYWHRDWYSLIDDHNSRGSYQKNYVWEGPLVRTKDK